MSRKEYRKGLVSIPIKTKCDRKWVVYKSFSTSLFFSPFNSNTSLPEHRNVGVKEEHFVIKKKTAYIATVPLNVNVGYAKWESDVYFVPRTKF